MLERKENLDSKIFYKDPQNISYTEYAGASTETKQNFLTPKIADKTESVRTENQGFRIVVPSQSDVKEKDAAQPKKKTSVDGSIIGVNESSVEIELYINNTTHTMSAPLGICPDGIHSGMPITFSQKLVDGVRKNVIAVRTPPPLTKAEQELLNGINLAEHGE